MIPDPTPDSIIQHLLDRFEGTRVVAAGGERSMFYNPGGESTFAALVMKGRNAQEASFAKSRATVWIRNVPGPKPTLDKVPCAAV